MQRGATVRSYEDTSSTTSEESEEPREYQPLGRGRPLGVFGLVFSASGTLLP